ncbi:MAG: hypothetical protein IPM69_14010 [Ignavibacteria bacterium]|nr:hypothetical protein [Ignavibacteria bacterium]
MKPNSIRLRSKIKGMIVFFIISLALSGITAFPLVELDILVRNFGAGTTTSHIFPALSEWLELVNRGLVETSVKYPFLAYGTDWLAFAHIVLAILFIGPLHDPVKNKWVIEFGMIACVLVIPLALICGPLRGIPVFWQIIDTSFGIIGIVPLLLVWKWIVRIENGEE